MGISHLLPLLFFTGLAAAQSQVLLQLNVSDGETGKPLPCRIHLQDGSGAYMAPENGPFFRNHFSCEGSATLNLSPGRYTYAIERGPEFSRDAGVLDVSSNTHFTASLHRIADLRAEGWWPGELHIHRALEDIETLLRSEDLYVGPVITWWNQQSRWDSAALPRRRLVNFDLDRYFHVMGGEDERNGGAFLYFGLDEPLEIRDAERDYPCPMAFVEEGRRRGAWIDLEKPFWWDAPIALGLGLVDSVGIANNHMWREGVLDNEAWGKPRLRETEPPTHANGLWTQEIYYHLLNTGLRIPPSAGSASGVIPNPVGYNRVYVHLDDALTYEDWWEGLRAGRSFVTNGPLLRVRVKDELPGHIFRRDGPVSLPIAARLTSNDPIKAVEIIQNGVVVDTMPVNKDGSLGMALITFEKSGWFLVRAIADVASTFRFGSTAPFYVEISGKPMKPHPESARFFLDWIEERNGRLEVTNAQRAETMGYHDRATAFWQERYDAGLAGE